MRYGPNNGYSGWHVLDVARGTLIKRVAWLDDVTREIAVYDDPAQIDRAKGEVIAHTFKFDMLKVDFNTKVFHVTMSVGPLDPASGKSWLDWLKGEPVSTKGDALPIAPAPAKLDVKAAPKGIGITEGRAEVPPPKGRL